MENLSREELLANANAAEREVLTINNALDELEAAEAEFRAKRRELADVRRTLLARRTLAVKLAANRPKADEVIAAQKAAPGVAVAKVGG